MERRRELVCSESDVESARQLFRERPQPDRFHAASLGVAIIAAMDQERPVRLHVVERHAKSLVHGGRQSTLDFDGPDPSARQFEDEVDQSNPIRK